MTKKKNLILKVATFLFALAPLIAGSERSVILLVGEPKLPTKFDQN